MSKTVAQERSAFALEMVLAIKDKQKEFKSLAEGLPAMILQNGFGLTLSFLLAKGEDHHTKLFQIITEWLRRRDLLRASESAAIMSELSAAEQQEYLQAQRESLALLEWVKRYAKAFFEDSQEK